MSSKYNLYYRGITIFDILKRRLNIRNSSFKFNVWDLSVNSLKFKGPC